MLTRMENINKIRIGTRGSKLALAQSYMVEDLLKKHYPNIQIEIITIQTTGDKILEKNLYEIGGKGLFIKEIEEQLLSGDIDIAVHSMKDMPAEIHSDFDISCILKREDPRDALICEIASSVDKLPQGATVGTSSPRRASQALFTRPDLKIVPFRGNIQTRLKKLQEKQVDATFLAIAGINRCKISEKCIHTIDKNIMLPAVAQGAIGIETLTKRQDLQQLLLPLNDEITNTCVKTERAFLKEFEGSCKTPIAALATINNGQIAADFLIANMDGTIAHKTSRNGNLENAEEIGQDAAKELSLLAGEGFFS